MEDKNKLTSTNENKDKPKSFIEEIKGSTYWYYIPGWLYPNIYFDIREIETFYITETINEDEDYFLIEVKIGFKSGVEKIAIPVNIGLGHKDALDNPMVDEFMLDLRETEEHLKRILAQI